MLLHSLSSGGQLVHSATVRVHSASVTMEIQGYTDWQHSTTLAKDPPKRESESLASRRKMDSQHIKQRLGSSRILPQQCTPPTSVDCNPADVHALRLLMCATTCTVAFTAAVQEEGESFKRGSSWTLQSWHAIYKSELIASQHAIAIAIAIFFIFIAPSDGIGMHWLRPSKPRLLASPSPP
jgi:hypothetical protein